MSVTAVKDSFLDLERQRQRLEGQASQLRKSLQYWRKWDADYETLKEEVNSVPIGSRSSQSAIRAIKESFDSEIATKKELEVIFGPDSAPRSFDQIISVIQGRIDTGSRNIASLERGLEATENKLAATMVIMSPDATDEESGMPITDIIEELDDEDNVLSYRLATPGDSSLQIRELLEKAGVKDLPPIDGQPATATPPAQQLPTSSAPASIPSTSTTATSSKPNAPPAPPATVSKTPEPAPKPQPTPKPKAVSKAPAPKATPKETVPVSQAPETSSKDTNSAAAPMSKAAQRVQNIMDTAKSHEEISKKDPIIPADESEEDAQLRNDMLRYGLGEVGAVVAEMFIDDVDDDDYDWDSEEDYESEEEDEFGKSKYSVITDDYRQHMLQLEKKLGFQSRYTRDLEEKIAAQADDEEKPGDEGIGRIVIQKEDSANATPAPTPAAALATPATPSTPPVAKTPESTGILKSATPKAASTEASPTESDTEVKSAKKSVRFAEMLDIAPQKPGDKTKAPAKLPKQDDDTFVDPLSDVVESSVGNKNKRTRPGGKRASRFKKALAAAGTKDSALPAPAMTPDAIPAPFSLDENKISGGAAAPAPPKGETVATTVVERATPPSDKAIINDDFDELTLQQEVADEYHKRRTRMIQQHGGFLKEEELPIQRVDEEEGTKRVSRFKAARLSKQ